MWTVDGCARARGPCSCLYRVCLKRSFIFNLFGQLFCFAGLLRAMYIGARPLLQRLIRRTAVQTRHLGEAMSHCSGRLCVRTVSSLSG